MPFLKGSILDDLIVTNIAVGVNCKLGTLISPIRRNPKNANVHAAQIISVSSVTGLFSHTSSLSNMDEVIGNLVRVPVDGFSLSALFTPFVKIYSRQHKLVLVLKSST